MPDDLPNLDAGCVDTPSLGRLRVTDPSTHPPRILLLYGSLRERSYSRFLTFEAERLLKHFGAETRIFDPHGLPLPDGAEVRHPKVQELRELALVGRPGLDQPGAARRNERGDEGADRLDSLSVGAVRPTQGRTLAVMQVSGGSQSFNAVNQMRVLGRWMRMVTIPNQSSVAKAFQEFDDAGRMKPSSYYDRVVDVMEELMKFTLLTRDVSPYLTDRYSERKESGEALMQRVNLTAAT
jgi:arsenic resistance protein ArsH